MSKEKCIDEATEMLKTVFKRKKENIYSKMLGENDVFEWLAQKIGFNEARLEWKNVVERAEE